MSGLGFSALLISRLLPRSWRAVEADLDERSGTMLRLGLALTAELALLLLLTVGAGLGVPAGR